MTSRTGGPPAAPTPCPRLHDSAAYVLSALDAADRQSYEAHLGTCAECSAAVADFARLPELMRASDGLTEPGAEDTAADEAVPQAPLPDTLLPRLLHAISAEERRARRRRIGLGLVAAAAAAVLGGASMAVVDANLGDRAGATASDTASDSGTANTDNPSGEAPERITLATEPGAPIEAFVMVQPKGWGTSFETHCTYTGSGPGDYPATSDYELVAVDASGQSHTVSTWAAGGGATVHVVPASSYLALDDIRALQLTTVDGTLIASATL